MELKDCRRCLDPFEGFGDYCPPCQLVLDAALLAELKAKVLKLEAKHLEALALIYAHGRQEAKISVADVCDEYLDKTGRLLGDVRERAEAIRLSNSHKKYLRRIK